MRTEGETLDYDESGEARSRKGRGGQIPELGDVVREAAK